jgi:hypothetical protein
VEEPQLIEDLYQLQAKTKTQLKVCIGGLHKKPGVADYDSAAYLLEFPTGAKAVFDVSAGCDLILASRLNLSVCPQGTHVRGSSDTAILCEFQRAE